MSLFSQYHSNDATRKAVVYDTAHWPIIDIKLDRSPYTLDAQTTAVWSCRLFFGPESPRQKLDGFLGPHLLLDEPVLLVACEGKVANQEGVISSFIKSKRQASLG